MSRAWLRLGSWCIALSCLVACGKHKVEAPTTQTPPEAARLELELVPQIGHSGVIMAISPLPDGRLVLTGGEDATLRLWDAGANYLLRVFTGLDQKVRSADTDAKRSLAAAGGLEGGVGVWKLDTGERLHQWKAHEGSVWGVAFSSDGKRLITVGGRNIRQWNVADATPVGQAIDLPEAVNSVAFDRERKRVLLAFPNHPRVQYVELASGRTLLDIDITNYSPNNVAVSPSGAFLVASGYGRRHRIWDAKSGELLREIVGDSDCIGVAVSPDEELLAIGCAGGDFVEYDPASGTPIREHHVWDGSVFAMAYSKDGEQLYLSKNDKLVVKSARDGQLLHSFEGSGYASADFALSGDGRRLVVRVDKSLYAWAPEEWRLIGVTEGELGFHSAALSQNGSVVVAGTSDKRKGPLVVWTPETGKLQHFLDPEHGSVDDVSVNADGSRAVVLRGRNEAGGDRREVLVVDLTSGQVLRTLNTGPSEPAIGGTLAGGAMLPPTGAHQPSAVTTARDGAILVGNSDGELMLFSPTGVRAETLWSTGKLETIQRVEVSSDGKLILTRTVEGEVSISSLERRALLWEASSPSRDAAFTGDSVALLGDGELKLYERSTGKALPSYPSEARAPMRFFGRSHYIAAAGRRTLQLRDFEHGQGVTVRFGREEWLAFTADGYFAASRGGGTLAAAVSRMNAYELGQLAARANRPDIVFSRLGLGNREMIEHFRQHYRRRLHKLGIDERTLTSSMVNAPEVKITDLNAASQATLKAELRVSRGELGSYSVYVDGSPVFGIAGKPIAGAKQQISETLTLPPGRRTIEVSARSREGLESMRARRVVEVPGNVQGDLYYVGVGVSEYRDRSLNLGYPHKDVADLAEVMKRGQDYSKVHTKLLTNEQATRAALSSLGKWLAAARPEDTVVLFLAGHGMHSNDDAAEYFFVTHDVDKKRLRETAFSFQALEEVLANVRALQKIVFLDTCESGDRDPEAATRIASVASARSLTPRTSRALVLTDAKRDKASTPRPYLLESNRMIYGDIFRRTGAIVFSSSRGSELSYERDELENGVFTEELLNALSTTRADQSHDGSVDLDELRQFLTKAVARATDGLQHPTVDRDNPAVQLAWSVKNTTASAGASTVRRPLDLEKLWNSDACRDAVTGFRRPCAAAQVQAEFGTAYIPSLHRDSISFGDVRIGSPESALPTPLTDHGSGWFAHVWSGVAFKVRGGLVVGFAIPLKMIQGLAVDRLVLTAMLGPPSRIVPQADEGRLTLEDLYYYDRGLVVLADRGGFVQAISVLAMSELDPSR